ncbi:type II toxin-antitoxin system RelE/ParE family toxin [Mesoflavibacter sp. CH_XMU1404-2]|uniref:type II toxin-antitoxin system RelE/ParE family toxin n=1 Tax=Mesoflavibacter sp. CH_XMU1404-2 TaxID=3107766 RepID=UPI0024394CC5|tara:strand:+ start:108 stop:398 length:291 start_codon:yes stop_codon:yes gene_type:complete
MANYKISIEAKKDLISIFKYSYIEFGISQAESYLKQLESSIEKLAANPNIGKARFEIKKGLFSIPELEHIIFYRIFKSHIRIVRILHQKRDLKNFL